MKRYRLAIFDYDGTLADSLPWFRTVFQDLIARFDLAPVSAEETLEIFAFMEAADESKRLSGQPVKISDVMKKNGG